MKRTTVCLSDRQWSLVECEARRRHTSVSAVIREALEGQYGGSDEGRPPPFAALFNDPRATPAREADDVIRREWASAIVRNR